MYSEVKGLSVVFKKILNTYGYKEVCISLSLCTNEVLNQNSKPLLTSVKQMSYVYDRTPWMIWAYKCLIEKVEKNPHKPQDCKVLSCSG